MAARLELFRGDCAGMRAVQAAREAVTSMTVEQCCARSLATASGNDLNVSESPRACSTVTTLRRTAPGGRCRGSNRFASFDRCHPCLAFIVSLSPAKPKALSAARGDSDIFDVLQSHILPCPTAAMSVEEAEHHATSRNGVQAKGSIMQSAARANPLRAERATPRNAQARFLSPRSGNRSSCDLAYRIPRNFSGGKTDN